MSEDGLLEPDVVSVLANAPCDTALLVSRPIHRLGPVVLPFGALEHDWAALELAAWLATALGVRLTLLGVRGPSDGGGRDSSRLLAEASLLVQQFLDVQPDTRLIETGADGILTSSEEGGPLVLGLPDRWRSEGVGSLRAAVARRSSVPVLLVRRGTRPGGLAPRDTATIFAWSMQHAGGPAEA
jgi:hypothetical protein